ncbi:coiled-coil domain-containing protein 12 isoform X3 [Enhydra lutris kenyoni]|uniref:Coiled-coil domain-containing protein 12 isoform X3 n=1 Tax=Enhydra lutris kenyoni TaxID=391180 RepID=A0A2Y9IYY6_ENHLU|nr:coiled-coil domain-containing protein 12 isoform X3 [Enhydra lutris kenyoni]
MQAMPALPLGALAEKGTGGAGELGDDWHQRAPQLRPLPLAKCMATDTCCLGSRKSCCAGTELRLRNYVPEDEDLKRRRVPPAKPVAVEEKVKEQLEAAKPEPIIEEVDLANLAPRKPDWGFGRGRSQGHTKPALTFRPPRTCLLQGPQERRS